VMLEQGDRNDADRPDVVRVVVGETGVCLDIVMADGVRAAPRIACIVVVGKDLGGLRFSLQAPQEPSEPARIQNGRDEPGQLVQVVAPSAARTPLSPRELEVLAHLAEGRSNKVIAQAMNISGETVRAHVKSIFRKAGLENRTQAALWAMAITASDNFVKMQDGLWNGETSEG